MLVESWNLILSFLLDSNCPSCLRMLGILILTPSSNHICIWAFCRLSWFLLGLVGNWNTILLAWIFHIWRILGYPKSTLVGSHVQMVDMLDLILLGQFCNYLSYLYSEMQGCLCMHLLFMTKNCNVSFVGH